MRVTRLLPSVVVAMVSVGGIHAKVVSASSSDLLRMENPFVVVEFEAETMSFSVVSKDSGLMFVERGTLASREGQVQRLIVRHPTWGDGEAIEASSRVGTVDRLMLFPGLPFVVFENTQANGTDADVTLGSIHPVNLVLGAKKEATGLRALGTAGLTGVGRDSNPGSYSFLVVADLESRAGFVAGWVTHERGSGLLFSDIKEDRAVVDARLDYGQLLVKPGKSVAPEILLIGYFADARLGLEAYADAVARHYRIHLSAQPTVYCTWYHAGASNEKDLLASAAFAKEHLVPFGFSVMQIDDGWQAGVTGNGPRKDFTTHRSDGPYPSGMRQTAEKIGQLGLTPGIWFMPFAGTWNDPFFADKQHLFATKDGKPFEVFWGGTCFDVTNPRTREYVRSVAARVGQEWGYKYFKLDGLWTGMAADILYVNTGYKDDRLGEAVLHDPEKTHVEAYRAGLKIVREAAGDDVFLLGCNVAQNMRTLGGSFGLLDAMRIGPDNGRKWPDMCRGPFSGSNLYFLHGRVWYNDPDPIYVSNDVPLDRARALVSWVTLTGQLNASSEDYKALSADRIHLLRRSMPAHGLKPRPVDLFEEKIARIWLLTDDRREPRRDVIGLFNWEEKTPTHIACAAERIGLPRADCYVGFDYWADEFLDPFGGVLESDLLPASCRIIAVRPISSQPQVLSTSRHITQGVVDLLQETWDNDAQTLRGTSHVVANDPYELRIAAMGQDGPWRVGDLAVSSVDSQEGASIQLVSQEDWRIRVRINTSRSQDVRWSIRFARAR
ncbi:MAG: glycoside hydrolase family 36 protein [Phycisphaerales bacterium]